MIAEEYLSRSRLYRRLRNEPHGELVELYASRLAQERLARQGTWRCLSLVGDLLSWIARSRSKLTDLDERMVERYLRHRARKQSIQPGGAEAVAVGAARRGHNRAGGAAADEPAGPDIRGVQRLSAKRTRFGAKDHRRPFTNDPPVSARGLHSRCGRPG